MSPSLRVPTVNILFRLCVVKLKLLMCPFAAALKCAFVCLWCDIEHVVLSMYCHGKMPLCL